MRTNQPEQLPTTTPKTGTQRNPAAQAAAQELAEIRLILRYPCQQYASPRIYQRYKQAIAWNALYQGNEDMTTEPTQDALKAATWIINMPNTPERTRLYNGRKQRQHDYIDNHGYRATDNTEADQWAIQQWNEAGRP